MMRAKNVTLTNFSGSQYSKSLCIRPDNESELIDYITNNPPVTMLARGSGISYGDSCFNKGGLIIDTQRLNHLISFDSTNALAVCQGGALIKDLFLMHPEFIPQVIPGTLYATVAGGIAHDVHGKNNPHVGSFGHHLHWIDLLIGDKLVRCSPKKNSDLFNATIGGLGLTGIIIRVAIQLKRASRCVQVGHKPFKSISELLKNMSTLGLNHDFQIAWIDLLHPEERSILSLATHCNPFPCKEASPHSIPKFPFSVIKKWNMKLFNKFYFDSKKSNEQLSLEQFNNPLDSVRHWNRLYGPKGLIQFQALFDEANAAETIDRLLQIIKQNQAIPTLTVLKLLTQSGKGLLSFCKPGYLLAIDFYNNHHSVAAVRAMNQLISEINGRVYLAKDLFLTPDQYHQMYPAWQEFSQILSQYHSTMRSDLSQRLRITP